MLHFRGRVVNLAALRAFGARFSSPVYPGESVSIELSRGGAGLQFRASVPERNQLVLSHGYATIA